MVAHLMMLLALQAPVVTANVDRTEVAYGDTLVLSIVVNARGASWVRLSDPDLDGLEAYSSQQVSNVERVGNEEQRRTERRLFLRATRTGTATIGSVRVQQGRRVTTTDPIAITVTGTGPGAPGSNAIVAAMLRRVPDPSGTGEVSVTILPSRDTVLIGEQLDLLVVAWFPRELRQRLRTQPTMQTPEVRGGWLYPSELPTDVVEQREFHGAVYDLYTHHQTLFPLSVDGFAVDRATVTYNLPLTDSFMSRELRQVVQSRLPRITLVRQPATGRSASFSGSSADSLTMDVTISRTAMEVGEAATLAVTLGGRGNVALWGEPAIEWPPGLNGYPAETEVATYRVAGRITGTKVFRYLLVADSVGSHRVVVDRYDFFDPGRAAYRSLPPAAVAVVATSGRPVFTTAEQLPLLEPDPGVSLPARLARVPMWLWLIVWAAGPLVALIASLRLPGRIRRATSRKEPVRPPLGTLNDKFSEVLGSLVSGSDLLEGRRLEDALVAAGVEPKLASHAVHVKHRLGQANYGPEGVGDFDELRAEIEEVSRALAGKHGFSYNRRLETVMTLLVLGCAAPLAAQEASAERLYGTRAYQAAADSFAVRVANDPTVAAHWLNLGNALAHSGEDGRALAAWVRAARLAPRDQVIRDALRGAHAWRVHAGRPFVSPVTSTEAYLASLALWLAAWLLVTARRRRLASLAFLLWLGAGATAIAVDRAYARPAAIVLEGDTPLREAPFVTAQRVTSLGVGDHVAVKDTHGAWYLVSFDGVDGWVLSRDLGQI